MIGDVMLTHKAIAWLALWVSWPTAVFAPLGQPLITGACALAGATHEIGRAVRRRHSRQQRLARREWSKALNEYVSSRGNSALYRPAEFGRARSATTSAQWRVIQDAPNQYGYVYVIQLSTGTIKVGKSIRPRVRLTTHDRAARAHKATLRRVWVSQAHLCYSETEKRAISFCQKNGTSASGEYFDGVDFYAIVDHIMTLDGSTNEYGIHSLKFEEISAFFDAAAEAHRSIKAKGMTIYSRNSRYSLDD